MSSILFLDIDGVLASRNFLDGFEEIGLDIQKAFNATNHEPFNLENFFWLNRLAIEFDDLKFVISSSWRNIHSKNEIEQAFRDVHARFLRAYHLSEEEFPFSIQFHEQWKTPKNTEFYHRGHEIQDWLNNDGEKGDGGCLIQNYAIVDDDPSMLLIHRERFIRTNGKVGFSLKDYSKAKEILNQDPKPLCCSPRTRMDELFTYL